jgi:hypothetical protein
MFLKKKSIRPVLSGISGISRRTLPKKVPGFQGWLSKLAATERKAYL